MAANKNLIPSVLKTRNLFSKTGMKNTLVNFPAKVYMICIAGLIFVAIVNETGLDYKSMNCAVPTNALPDKKTLSWRCYYYGTLFSTPHLEDVHTDLRAYLDDPKKKQSSIVIIRWQPFTTLVFIACVFILVSGIALLKFLRNMYHEDIGKISEKLSNAINVPGKENENIKKMLKEQINLVNVAHSVDNTCDNKKIIDEKIQDFKFSSDKLKESKKGFVDLMLRFLAFVILFGVYMLVSFIYFNDPNLEPWDRWLPYNFFIGLFQSPFQQRAFPIKLFCLTETRQVMHQQDVDTTYVFECAVSRNFLVFILVNGVRLLIGFAMLALVADLVYVLVADFKEQLRPETKLQTLRMSERESLVVKNMQDINARGSVSGSS